jgi:DNA-3-methyladenine glycosylase II
MAGMDAYDELARLDPALAKVMDRVGRPDPFVWNPILSRVGGDHFRAMLLQIISQQISAAAAWSIFDRVVAALDGEPTPAAVLAIGPDRLRALGLSHAKAVSVADLSDAVLTGRVDLDHVSGDDEAAIAMLSTVRGVGRWSAEIFLIAQFHRPDILPAGDLGIRQGIKRVWELPEIPSIKQARTRGLAWSPFRTYAAILLWNSLR